MKTFHLSFLIFLFSCTSLLAQGVFKFEKDTHDFGAIEEGGTSDYVFKFTNSGTAPIIIQGVRASCGCTTPDWTKEPVPPGGEGFVKASYNTVGRPGQFNKSITITSNATEASKALIIKGEVKMDPAKQPILEVEKAVVSLGKIKEGEDVKVTVKIKNIGKGALNIYGLSSASNTAKLIKASPGLAENASGELEFTIKAQNVGKLSEIIHISTNSHTKPNIEFRVEGEVIKSASTSPMREGNNTPFGK